MVTADTMFLLFCFAAAFLFVCLLILFFLSNSRQAKGWYLFFMLSFVGWFWFLLAKPQWVGNFWLFILPLLWIAGSMKASSPLTSKAPSYHPNGEPRVTQEQLKGRAGTLEALKLYFLLLMAGLVLFLTFFLAVSWNS